MIRFGTDGWRAVIGDEFTFANVRRVARAHAEVLKEKGLRSVVVGYDYRFASEDFASEVCSVLAGEGLEVALSESACTTPMVSFGVRYLNFDGGVMITASHNPPRYNGYKIKESFGGSATPEFVREVESRIPPESLQVRGKGDVGRVDLRTPYVNKAREWIETELFREKTLRVVHDAMFGTSAGLFGEVLRGTKAEVIAIRSYRDPLFGGHAPEPVEKHLRILMEKVRACEADVGIANDGDGDRISLVDERGVFINTQLVFVLLLIHLLKHRKMKDGIVVKTVSTTYLADRVCRSEGIELREVPVGFKNINELILREKVLFGGEESGGYGIPEYLPERDGLVSGLLILELMALTGRKLSEIVEDVFRTYGSAYYRRTDLPADDRLKERLKDLIKNPPHRLGGRKIAGINTSDGLKLIFEDESWLLFRASGTEPLIRVYAEAPSQKELDSLLTSGAELLKV